MIVTEHSLRDIFNQIPSMQLNPQVSRKPRFHWGDKLELARYLTAKKDDSYPLIYLMPSEVTHSDHGNEAKRNCTFIIATLEEDLNLFNNERYKKSYDLLLNPLTEYVVKGLSSSGISSIDGDYKTLNYPNYSDEAYNESGTIELWDAVKLTCDVTFINNCIKTIQWQNQ